MFLLNLDISSLIKLNEELIPAAKRAMNRAAADLAAQTHAHIVEQVQNQLHSTRERYLESLSFKQVDEDVWVVELDPGALWIEEGLPPNREMIDDLLNDSPKPWVKKDKGMPSGRTQTAKDGSRYRVIPFQHNKAPTTQTQAQKSLSETIKREFKRQKIPFGKLETDPNGKPQIGHVRTVDLTRAANKGQIPKNKEGKPVLTAVHVYQRQITDKKGVTGVKKFIMTFAVVSSKQKGSGKWVHPGIEAKKFFDEAYEWAMKEWENKIAPQVVEEVANSI